MVEGARLEIVWASNSLGGSNPLASARKFLEMVPFGAIFENFLLKKLRIRAQGSHRHEVSITYLSLPPNNIKELHREI